MEIVRTDKQFTKENMSIDFIKQAVAIACAESHVLKYEDDMFDVEVNFHGRGINGSSVTPWRDERADRYVKKVSCVYIRLKNGFDSYARIFDKNASLQGFFNLEENDPRKEKTVCQVDTVRWTNLLLKNGFLEIAITMETEKVFSTSLNRLEKIYEITGDKKFKLQPPLYKERLRDLEDRLEKIVAEIYYKRVVEPVVIREIRSGYIDFDKDTDFLTFDRYGYCEELWNECYVLIDESIFEGLFRATKNREINNIEKHNLKLI